MDSFGNEELGSLWKASKATTRFDFHYFFFSSFSFLFTFHTLATLVFRTQRHKTEETWTSIGFITITRMNLIKRRRFGTIFIVKRLFCFVSRSTKLDKRICKVLFSNEFHLHFQLYTFLTRQHNKRDHAERKIIVNDIVCKFTKSSEKGYKRQ